MSGKGFTTEFCLDTCQRMTIVRQMHGICIKFWDNQTDRDTFVYYTQPDSQTQMTSHPMTRRQTKKEPPIGVHRKQNSRMHTRTSATSTELRTPVGSRFSYVLLRQHSDQASFIITTASSFELACPFFFERVRVNRNLTYLVSPLILVRRSFP